MVSLLNIIFLKKLPWRMFGLRLSLNEAISHTHTHTHTHTHRERERERQRETERERQRERESDQTSHAGVLARIGT